MVAARKLELDGKRWAEGGYAYGYDYNYARNMDLSLKQIRCDLAIDEEHV